MYLTIAQGAHLQVNFFTKRRGCEAKRVFEQRLQLCFSLFDVHSRLQSSKRPHRATWISTALCGYIQCLWQQNVGRL